MKKLTTSLVCLLLASACTLPPMLGGSGNAHQTSYSKTSRTEEINGKPIASNDDMGPPPPELQMQEPRSHKKSKEVERSTCRHNSDCASKTCFVGSGELGYCTKMCDSFSECPAHWDCKKAGNAPQKICMQDNDW
jgi:hypothetical protein